MEHEPELRRGGDRAAEDAQMMAPLSFTSPTQTNAGRLPDARPSADPAPLRMLLIEDNPGDARLIRELLRKAEGPRWQVEWRERLSAGLERLAGGAVDAILLDLGLPDSQGLDTLRRVQQHAPELPIVVLSGLQDEQLALRAVHEGAQDYLVKGQADGRLLTRALCYAIERERAEQERAELLARARAAQADAEEALRTRDAVVASVTHDLRNPLTAILGYVKLLERQLARGPGDSDAMRAALARINGAAEQIRALTDELLDAARLQAGEALELNRQPTDLVALAGEAIATLAEQGGHVEARLEARAGALVGQWDRRRLERVLENLLSNAAKYSPGGGEVVVGVERRGGWAVLRVRDRGVGIPAADLPRVFERFHRAGNVRGRLHGTGLGLWGARRIAEQHGGAIELESREGQGTTVTLRLPLGEPADTMAASTSPKASPASVPVSAEQATADSEQPRRVTDAPRGGTRRKRALVVEDDLGMRTVIERLLVERGFEIFHASNGYAALRLAQREQPDVVLLDLALPEIPGPAVLRLLREFADTRALPVIVVSGAPDALTEGEARTVQGILRKPFVSADLVRQVELAALPG